MIFFNTVEFFIFNNNIVSFYLFLISGIQAAFCYSWPKHINGMYVCVLGIPKGKFSKQMKKKYLVTELYFICL